MMSTRPCYCGGDEETAVSHLHIILAESAASTTDANSAHKVGNNRRW